MLMTPINSLVLAVSRPFRIQFKTDANELPTTAAGTDATDAEQMVAPGGIVGFNLNFVQQSC